MYLITSIQFLGKFLLKIIEKQRAQDRQGNLGKYVVVGEGVFTRYQYLF